MNQENYPLSDLDSLLSKDNITENDLLQLPEPIPDEPKTPSNWTSITHELENLSITPTDKPTIPLNDWPRERRSTIPQNSSFENWEKRRTYAWLQFHQKPTVPVKSNLQNERKHKSVENSILGIQTTRINPWKPITQFPTNICPPHINLYWFF